MNAAEQEGKLSSRPLSTYRLQLHGKFGFADARRVLAYLHELGISDIYSSPYLKAASGSMHGYDVVNPTVLNDELGPADVYRAFSDEMRSRRLGHILDVVPNHMGIGEGNEWWWDVLENGTSSRYAAWFDIDWTPPKRSLLGRVLLPFLGGQLPEVIERGELKLRRDGEMLVLAYADFRFPLSPRSLGPILRDAETRLSKGALALERQELRSIARGLRMLDEHAANNREGKLDRADEIAVLRRRLTALLHEQPAIEVAVDQTLAIWSGTKDEPDSFEHLEQVIGEQHYRLADWHVAAEEINYRRFFDVTQLAALRMEDPEVFEETHAFVLKLLAGGSARGLRLDHTDGLREPLEYLRRLRAHTADNTSGVYVIAEKILGAGEELPQDWPIEGTTGYDFMTSLSGVLLDPRGEEPLTSFYRSFTGDLRSYADHATECRRLVMRASLPSEVHTLVRMLAQLAEQGRRPHDFTEEELKSAVTETIAAFPVYRTYLVAHGPVSPTDQRYLETAISAARARNPQLGSVLDFLKDTLLMKPLPGTDRSVREEQTKFVLRFQQLTPPMMAKGVEDTAFYTYRRMLALNDVGGDPGRFGTSIQSFHEQNARRRERWPLTMLTSSTHDNKRGEDVRARLAVLSEVPGAWAAAVRSWSDQLIAYKTVLPDGAHPGRSDEYLFFQTVVGALPFDGKVSAEFIERIAAYCKKATSEAKQHTSWLSPNKPYEGAIDKFVRSALADEAFCTSLGDFTRSILNAGIVNSLSQVALKLCSPGVADTYQGCEDWNLSLVDPDNRRPVDYAGLSGRLRRLRSALKADDRAALCGSLLARAGAGDIKLFATHMLLQERRRDEALFLDGDYVPLDLGEHAIGFSRTFERRTLVCLVPKSPLTRSQGHSWPLGEVWKSSAAHVQLLGARYRDVFTGGEFPGGRIPLADVFARFPVAVLFTESRESESGDGRQ